MNLHRDEPFGRPKEDFSGGLRERRRLCVCSPGVEEVVVGGWGQGVGARGFVHGAIDKEVRNLTGNACAWICVLRSDHAHAPAVTTFKFVLRVCKG
jgi:hypothetical protein